MNSCIMFTDAMAPEVFRMSKSFMNLKSSPLSLILSISLTDRTLSEDTVHVSSALDSNAVTILTVLKRN